MATDKDTAVDQTVDMLTARLTARVQALEHECGDLQRKNDLLGLDRKNLRASLEAANGDLARARREWSLASQRVESLTKLCQEQGEVMGRLAEENRLLVDQAACLNALVADKAEINVRLTEQVARLQEAAVPRWLLDPEQREQPVWRHDQSLLATTRAQLAAGWEPPLAEAAKNCLEEVRLSMAVGLPSADNMARTEVRRESILQRYDGVPCPRCGKLRTAGSAEINSRVCDECGAEGKMMPTEGTAAYNMTRAEVKAEPELLGIDAGPAVDRVLTAVTAEEVRRAAHHPNKQEGLIDLERE